MKKILFLGFTKCKTEKSEENKFLEIYLSIMENEKKNEEKIIFYDFTSSKIEENGRK